MLAALLFGQLLFLSVAVAGDFDWLNNLNVRAEADSSGFRVSLATRFNIGDVKVNAVVNSVENLSDAYLVLRLGELSHQPIEQVISVYRANRTKGWGVVAKKLGIKPGSREFHALKRGHDLDNGHSHGNGNSSGKGKDKGKGKGKNKG
jgi:hypothetical protein